MFFDLPSDKTCIHPEHEPADWPLHPTRKGIPPCLPRLQDGQRRYPAGLLPHPTRSSQADRGAGLEAGACGADRSPAGNCSQPEKPSVCTRSLGLKQPAYVHANARRGATATRGRPPTPDGRRNHCCPRKPYRGQRCAVSLTYRSAVLALQKRDVAR